MSRSMCRSPRWSVVLTLFTLLPLSTRAAEPAEVLKAAGVEAGLCVHLGTTDGRLELGLTNGGRILVHGLTTDEAAAAAAREFLRSNGAYGLASVDRATGLSPLPYADNLINLLVADLDALGDNAPPEAELMRAVAPTGVAYLKRGGAWAKVAKPMPKEMDGWTHFHHGPDGNPVSNDEIVGPPTGLQWIAGVECDGAHPVNGYRLDRGMAVYHWGYEVERKGERSFVFGRDAFSGVARWTVPTPVRPYKTSPMVLDGGRIYTHLADDGPLVAMDLATGKVARTYDAAGRAVKTKSGDSAVNLVVHGGLLLQTSGDTVRAVDAATGELRWQHTEPAGGFVDFPTVGADVGRLFLVTSPKPRGHDRYPGIDARAVVALDLATGKEQWRHDVGRSLAQIAYVDGKVVAFETLCGIGRQRDLFLAMIDPKDGRRVWTMDKSPRGQLLDMAVVGGTVNVMSNALNRYDAATGALVGEYNMPLNARCDMSRATKNWLLMSFGNFVDLRADPPAITRVEISRSTCGGGSTPGYGMMYHWPNRCGCAATVRGFMALSTEPARAPVDDAKRLETGPAAAHPDAGAKPAATGAAAAAVHAEDWPTFMADPMRSNASATALPADPKPLWTIKPQARATAAAGPVAEDWLLSSAYVGPVTAPVIAGGRVYVAVPEAHRVDAYDADTGRPLWSFTAGGRVDTPPTIHDAGGGAALCLFGGRDGRVYALDAATGALAWRFLAAPADRRMVAHSQIESTWPVFGSLVVAGGNVVAVAGYHPEANGGLLAWGLDPRTGKVAWKRPIAHARGTAPLGSKDVRAATAALGGETSNRVINEIPVSDGTLVGIGGLVLEGATGAEVKGVKADPKAKTKAVPAMPNALAIGFRSPNRNQKLESYGGPGPGAGCSFLRLSTPKSVELYGDRLAWGRDRAACDLNGSIHIWDLTRDGDVVNRPNSRTTEQWLVRRDAFKGAATTSLLLAGDQVLVGTSAPGPHDEAAKGAIHRFSARDGAPLGVIPLDAGVIENGLAAARGRLYVTCEDGSVVCLGE